MNKLILAAALATALAGCGIDPSSGSPLPTSHPAHPEAAPAARPPAPTPESASTPAAPYPLDTCVVSGQKLGEMGDPVILHHEGREVRLCCGNCIEKFRKDPATYLKKLDEAHKGHH